MRQMVGYKGKHGVILTPPGDELAGIGGESREYEVAFLNSIRFRDQPKDGFIYNFQWKSHQIWSGFSELMHH
jgi:hypothetical protein